MFTKKISSFLAVLICAICTFASAQDASQIPIRETAGAEQERFQRETEMQQAERNLKTAPKDEAAVEADDSDAVTGGPFFELKGIQVTGNQIIPSAELEPLAAEWIGKQVDLRDLKKIVSKIKSYYRDQRFIAAYVYISPQKVSGGVVEFVVVEGRIGNVTIEGNRWYSERVLKRAIHLTENEVLSFPELQSSLSYLNEQPDIKAKASLKPGAEKDTTDIVFDIKDKFPLHINTDINNLGTDNTGITRWGVGLTHNNLLGQMDKLATRFQLGSGAWAIGTQYNVPVGPYRTQVGFSHSHSRVHLGGDFKALNIRGKASTYGLEILQPVKLVSFLKTTFNIGFDAKSVENRILGTKAGRDELRILNTGVNIEQSDRWGRTYFPHTFHVGFAGFMGASDKFERGATRAGTGGQFFIYRGSFIRYQRLPAGMMLTSRANWQLTPDRLAPSEQLRLGGAFSVRGYSEGDYLADYGAFLTNELSIPSYFFPEDWKLPYSSMSLRQQIQAIGFFDFGGGALRKPLNGERDNKTLSGAGGGLKVHLFDHIYGRFQWAARLGSEAADGAGSAFYYGISAEAP